MKKILKFIVFLALLALLPFLADTIVVEWDMSRNAMTRDAGIVMNGGAVHSGNNRHEFKETRFRSKGMSVSILFSSISEEEINVVENELSGTLKFTKSGKPVCSFRFKPKITMKRDSGSAMMSPGGLMPASLYDIQCKLNPISSAEDEAAWQMLRGYEFNRGESAEFDIEFDGYVPHGGKFIFSYSMCPRSLLHGTFLDFGR